MERLSTGKRINYAKDDAAGSAIAVRLTAEIQGLALPHEMQLTVRVYWIQLKEHFRRHKHF